MKITIEIDTETYKVILKGEPLADAVKYILEEGPSVLGRYYGKLLGQMNPSNKLEIIGHTPMNFPTYAVNALMEDEVIKTYGKKEE